MSLCHKVRFYSCLIVTQIFRLLLQERHKIKRDLPFEPQTQTKQTLHTTLFYPPTIAIMLTEARQSRPVAERMPTPDDSHPMFHMSAEQQQQQAQAPRRANRRPPSRSSSAESSHTANNNGLLPEDAPFGCGPLQQIAISK